MLTGNFTHELTNQRVAQLRTDVTTHRAAQRVAEDRKAQGQPSQRVLVLYRKALRIVAVGAVRR